MKLPVLFAILSWTWVMPAALFSADRTVIGLTRGRTPIEAVSVAANAADAPVVLIVGGLDGHSAAIVTQEVNQYAASKKRPYRLLAIAQANPDTAQLSFPPAGRAYRDNPESHYLWRWIGIQAPDLVLIADQEDFGLAEALSGNAVAGMGRIPARRARRSSPSISTCGGCFGEDSRNSLANGIASAIPSGTLSPVTMMYLRFGNDF